MTLSEWLGQLAPIATAIGVCVGALSLVNSKRQAVTAFEDDLTREYRQISKQLPTPALLGEMLSECEVHSHLPDFYQYFDLTNNQIFLRQIGRVSNKTWTFWVDGIETNLRRPAFVRSWKDISERSKTDFSELRRLIGEEFRVDPKTW